ncbi:NAD(P)-dependent oxidoreductase [Pedobacter metabolipauper]|uniref:3-hydroxyisobutyrate dehydrogenase n=1 Tax=Pedobacter metabolipauper TaxID=425513 RepID=A0A4V6PW30_9SPHI|nr:NAD(P)-dependent oxidoreductase [Pedobacter metabolipauper]TDQ11903.1 3-hydroxyisobutyrate dehydrogenase [Pedobacter metabolipauper]
MNTTKIGWIGLGNMGNPMSQQLIDAAYPVTVYNRSKEKAETLRSLGAAVASSPKELIELNEVVFMMVSDDQAIDDLFNGTDGLLAANVRGKVIVNMSTVSPGISKAFSQLCKEQGNYYLDAPVSGSVKQAETGQLVIMVGGDESAFQQVKPIFEKLGKLNKRIGDSGSGNTAKLAINTLLGFYAQGLSEALVFAQQHHIPNEAMMELINNSALSSVFIKIKGDAIINENYNAAFALKHIAKDLRLAKDEGLDSPLANVLFQTFQQAEPEYGNEDIIAIMKQIR